MPDRKEYKIGTRTGTEVEGNTNLDFTLERLQIEQNERIDRENAEYERHMADLRRRHPNMDW